jgi:hypothetical protein
LPADIPKDDAGNGPPGKESCIGIAGLQLQFDDSDMACNAFLDGYHRRGYCL